MNEDTAKHFVFTDAVIENISFDDGNIYLDMNNVYISRFSRVTDTKYDVTASGKLVLTNASVEKVIMPSRSYILPEPAAGNPFKRAHPPVKRKTEEKLIYKSGYEAFFTSLKDSDVIRLRHDGDRSIGLTASADGNIYEISFTAEDENFFPDSMTPVKRSIKDEAVYLNSLIPVVFSALAHKKTPVGAKILCAAAAGYFLSPVDLIPDFIPGLGYIDDLLITPLLVSLAVRRIPADVFEECREKAVIKERSKKFIYALPIIIFWVLVIIMLTAVICGIAGLITG